MVTKSINIKKYILNSISNVLKTKVMENKTVRNLLFLYSLDLPSSRTSFKYLFFRIDDTLDLSLLQKCNIVPEPELEYFYLLKYLNNIQIKTFVRLCAKIALLLMSSNI